MPSYALSDSADIPCATGFLVRNFSANTFQLADRLHDYRTALLNYPPIAEALGDTQLRLLRLSASEALEWFILRLSGEYRIDLQKPFLEFVKSKNELHSLLSKPIAHGATPRPKLMCHVVKPPRSESESLRSSTFEQRAIDLDKLAAKCRRDGQYLMAARNFRLAAILWKRVDGRNSQELESSAKAWNARALEHESSNHYERAATSHFHSALAWKRLAQITPATASILPAPEESALRRAHDLQSAAASDAARKASELDLARDYPAAIFWWGEAVSRWKDLGAEGERSAIAAEAAGVRARASFTCDQGAMFRAAELHSQAATLYEQLHDDRNATDQRGWAAACRSTGHVTHGQFAEARTNLDEATNLFRSVNDTPGVKWSEARSAEMATYMAYEEGDLEEAGAQGALQIQRWKECDQPENAEAARQWLASLHIPFEDV